MEDFTEEKALLENVGAGVTIHNALELLQEIINALTGLMLIRFKPSDVLPLLCRIHTVTVTQKIPKLIKN